MLPPPNICVADYLQSRDLVHFGSTAARLLIWEHAD